MVARGVTARAATPVAMVVGSLLSLVNSARRLHGRTLGVAIKVAVSYLTPFIVASIGFLTGGDVLLSTPTRCNAHA